MALLTLDEAKAQLNITGTGEDAELQAYVNAVTPVIERFVGPVEPREVVEAHDGGVRLVLVLRQTPVLSLTSVAAVLTGSTAPAVDALVLVDPDSGEVRRRDGGYLRGLLQVTYQAGRPEVPPTINLAARILVQHLWRTQRPTRGGGLAGGGDDYSVSEPIPGFGYAVPNRVLELLEPYRLPPGVA